jgi:penicillin-binding protein 2
MLKDVKDIPEVRFPMSEHTFEKITDAMYGVVNEPGGTGGQLKLAGIELSGKSGTAQVIGYDTRNRFGKQKKFEDNAWFVGYAPRRNPEICVAVLVQESGQHGGEAAGPVVRDIVKAYYDKKNRVPPGTVTADGPGSSPANATAVVAPAVVVKEEEPGTAQTNSSDGNRNDP